MTDYPEPIASALIVNSKNEILLVKSPKWKEYCVPGGHIEIGERIEDTIKREVKEELGLDLELVKVIFAQEAIFPKNLIGKKKHYIFLECLFRTVKSENVKMDGVEIIEYLWVTPEKALKMKIDPYTLNAIKKYLQEK